MLVTTMTSFLIVVVIIIDFVVAPADAFALSDG
jgi:hypothetical protein